jgi:hypothetical protein
MSKYHSTLKMWLILLMLPSLKMPPCGLSVVLLLLAVSHRSVKIITTHACLLAYSHRWFGSARSKCFPRTTQCCVCQCSTKGNPPCCIECLLPFASTWPWLPLISTDWWGESSHWSWYKVSTGEEKEYDGNRKLIIHACFAHWTEESALWSALWSSTFCQQR